MMAASPWPMPGVSTTTRSTPLVLHAAMASSRHSGTSLDPRVASERKNTDGESSAFMRMRSPSSAPPPRRRVGSTAMTATRSLSWKSSRNRRMSSSVSDDLPDPPVPVMPRTGTGRWAARERSSASRSGSSAPASSSVMMWARARGEPLVSGSSDVVGSPTGSTSHSSTSWLIMRARPSSAPSSGVKILVTPLAYISSMSAGTITPPPPPYTLT